MVDRIFAGRRLPLKAFQPQLKCLFISGEISMGLRGYCYTLQEIFLQSSLTIYMKKMLHLKVSMCLEYVARKLVKVKAYNRRINGKAVKVRSHYRRVWGR